MEREELISFYFIGFDVNKMIDFISRVLLEYNKPADKIQLLLKGLIQNPVLLIEVYKFLLEKESPKYNLILLLNSDNQIIKIY